MFCRGHIFGTSYCTKNTVPIDLKLYKYDGPTEHAYDQNVVYLLYPGMKTTMNKSRVNQILKTDPKVISFIQKRYNKLQGFG